jgi:hypothetical protein
MKLKQLLNCALFFLLILFVTGCDFGNPGYEKVDNKWAYVSYDEGAGKGIISLQVDESTFEIMNDKEYAKDKSKVFFQGNQIEGADSKTFKVLEKGYSCDKYQVYMDLETVIGANPKHFKLMEYPYSRDEKTIFCGTIPMTVNDKKGFKVTKKGDMISSELTTTFIQENPDYSYIDTLKYKGVIYTIDSEAETISEKFQGYKKK